MNIAPISAVDVRSANNVNFQKKQISKPVNTLKSVFIPTAIFLTTMFPSASNKINQTEMENKAVVLNEQNSKLPYYIQPESVQYSKDFEMEGEKYTMYYTDYCQKFSDRKDAVLEIFFVPENFELIKKGQEELNSPLKLEQLIYHNLENADENFVSAVVSEATCDKDGSNYQHITKEIVLPETIAKELLDLYNGKSDLYLVPGVNTYSEVNTSDMAEPVVQQGKIMLKPY